MGIMKDIKDTLDREKELKTKPPYLLFNYKTKQTIKEVFGQETLSRLNYKTYIVPSDIADDGEILKVEDQEK